MRLRNYYKYHRYTKISKHLETITTRPNDRRPYATVKIKGQQLTGLLDTGASVSCFGRGGLQLLTKLGVTCTEISSSVRTADGSSQNIYGICPLQVEFRGRTRTIRFHIVPTLAQPIYLGIDFWHTFGLGVLPMDEINDTESAKHKLTARDQVRLEEVISLYTGIGKNFTTGTPNRRRKCIASKTTALPRITGHPGAYVCRTGPDDRPWCYRGEP